MVPVYAFFDIDGTLSAPCYINDKGEPVIGFTMEGWKAFTAERQEHSYDACRPVPYVKAFAEKLKREGTVLYILTTSRFSGETKAKHVFIDTHYSGLFDKLITVYSDAEKLSVI
jgi:FMN phosphatase YigB (HAD superfamily)